MDIKVLVVEDSNVSRKLLAENFQKVGHTILEASNGEEGIEIWEKESPDFVVTDWNMPVKSGLELVKHIRRSSSHQYYTYIILITARDDEDCISKAFEAGVDDYLTKPVNYRELSLRIKAGERLLNLQSKDLIVFALARLAEIRDKETGDHLERIRQYSKLLAEKMSQTAKYKNIINPNYIKNLYDTSPLHDIGKVGIPDYILLKEGKLTQEEFDIMKTHTILGKTTLEEVSRNANRGFLKMAIEIAGSHHEKWNGSGYPLGLKGLEIPLSARLVALADVYDALRSKRSYKERMPHKKACQIIVKDSGTHFDPDVVYAFMEIENRFKEISERYEPKE